MRSNTLLAGIVGVTLIPVTLLAALSPTIGVVTALGTFSINSSRLESNANVFEGSRIDTDRSSTQVFLQGGPSVMLGTNSSATLFREHMVLSKGATKIDQLGNYQVQALGISVKGDDVTAKALVRLEGSQLQVASLAGSLQVFNAKGAMLTRVGTGSSAFFSPAGQSGMMADQSGAMDGKQLSVRTQVLGYSGAAGALAVLGLAVDAGLQRHSLTDDPLASFGLTVHTEVQRQPTSP